MNEKKQRLQSLVEKIENITTLIVIGNKKEGFEELNKIMEELTNVLAEMLNNVEKLASFGVDIPNEVILQQLQNIVEALENRDSILLTDTLHYEIANTLLFYIDIMNECEKENIVL